MLIQVMQVVLSIILLIRIGCILRGKTESYKMTLTSVYMLVITLAAYYMAYIIRSIFTSILFILTVTNFIINKVYIRMSYKKYKFSFLDFCLDFMEGVSMVLLIAAYINCST